MQSVLKQDHKDWRAILIDDCSIDNSISYVPQDARISLIRNSRRVTALPNIHQAIVSAGLEDEDIICILDGDDRLTGANVLNLIDHIYKQYHPLISYGQYVTSTGLIGHCRAYDIQSFQRLRHNQYWASHFRTFKYKLYKQIALQDPGLTCFRDMKGDMYSVAYDVAIMTPLLEIAGLQNIFFNPYPVYLYRIHGNNDHATNFAEQTLTAKEIYSKPKFQQIF